MPRMGSFVVKFSLKIGHLYRKRHQAFGGDKIHDERRGIKVPVRREFAGLFPVVFLQFVMECCEELRPILI